MFVKTQMSWGEEVQRPRGRLHRRGQRRYRGATGGAKGRREEVHREAKAKIKDKKWDPNICKKERPGSWIGQLKIPEGPMGRRAFRVMEVAGPHCTERRCKNKENLPRDGR